MHFLTRCYKIICKKNFAKNVNFPILLSLSIILCFIDDYLIKRIETSWDRPKSAPYPRLKNSKRTSKCQFTVLENRKTKKVDRVARRGTLLKLSTFLSQLEGTLWRKNKFSKKSLTMPKNRMGDPSGFLNTHSAVKYQRD